MKKLLSLMAAIALMLTLAGCGEEKKEDVKPVEQEVKEKTTEVKGYGYGGEMVLNVTTKGKKIIDIELVSDKETAPVFDRAFPIIKADIIRANSPIVDNVSGATYSSLAVKKAVAEVMKAEGKDFGEISTSTSTMTTQKRGQKPVDTDLVIVGGGPAGLAAALTAKENGVENIIVVEKMDILSGNGKFDMNFFDLYTSEATKANGNDMTKEEFIKSKADYWDGKERVERWADVNETLDAWLRDKGIELNFNYGSGSNHMARDNEYAGNVIQTGLEDAIKKANIDVRTRTKAIDIHFDESGKANGIRVETGSGFYTINAKAVIIATGGFSANKELLNKYAPGHDAWMTSNQMGATGDMVPLFEKYNLKLDHMDTLSKFTNILNPRRDLTGGADVAFRVDASGKDAPASPEDAFYITDKAGYDSFYRIRKHVDANYYQEAATLEELAKKLGVDYAGLKANVDEYNKSKDAEREFGAEGPFYGAKVVSAIHMTKGGVVANENAEVINNDDQVVPGLYAAGEVTSTRGAYNAAVVFGKVSGEEAANYILGK